MKNHYMSIKFCLYSAIILIFTISLYVVPTYSFNSAIATNDINTLQAIEGSNDTSSVADEAIQKIALIKNKFTYAAYQNGSFYNFYGMYSPGMFDRLDDDLNTTITNNLNLLTARPIPEGEFPFYLHPAYKDEPYIQYYYLIHDLAKRNNTIVENLTDMDVDQGKIFRENGENAYDVLILFHNEYVSQSEYNNLKRFVENGGTILFTEGNVLYAEIDYDPVNETITLVDGHNWKFNGTAAVNSVAERWLDENRDWMGSNFLNVPSGKPFPFKFNPFNYTHTEEQHLTNSKAKILLNYEAYNLPEEYSNATVATYEMQYGKGKIVHLGLWGHMVKDNPLFIDYMDRVLIPLALGQNVTELNNSFIKDALNMANSTKSVSDDSEQRFNDTQLVVDSQNPRS